MSQIHLLYHLQQIDSEIKTKKERLREVLLAQQQNKSVLDARQRATATEATLNQLQAQQKNLELELGGVNTKAQQSEKRMYSGKVSNPKELADLQQEIEALGRRRQALEDDILEVMVLGEDTDAEYQEATATLAEREAEWAEKLKRLQAEQNGLAVRINDLIAQRNEQVQRIDERMLKVYAATGRNRNGLAVTILRGGSCSACGVTASARKVREVEEGNLVHCGSCGRILYAG
jgi:predicted  nucleic acid-binding Zn-ribbon protein